MLTFLCKLLKKKTAVSFFHSVWMQLHHMWFKIDFVCLRVYVWVGQIETNLPFKPTGWSVRALSQLFFFLVKKKKNSAATVYWLRKQTQKQT